MQCKNCGKVDRLIEGKGLCEKCYRELLKRRIYKKAKCVFCGEEKIIAAHGLCRACYQRKQKNGTPEYVKVRKVCSVDGCENVSVANQLCDMHYRRWKRHGHLNQTRPIGWGSKEKHPLHSIWAWRKRSKDYVLSERWKDFWNFVEDVGDRPSLKHTIKAIDPKNELGRENFEWYVPIIVSENTNGIKRQRNNYMTAWREKNARKVKSNKLKTTYGITLDDYDSLLEEQKGVCAICGKKEVLKQKGKETPQDLAVDHCHATGKVRGLLCRKCNTGIGNFHDSEEIMLKAIQYINSH